MARVFTPFLLKSLLLTVFVHFHFLTYAASGVYGGGLVINGTNYGLDYAPSFNGATFSVASGVSLPLTFSFAKAWKDAGSDVCSGRMFYSVYPSGGSPTFTNLNLPTFTGTGGNNHEWSASGLSINLASGLSAGNYKIAVWVEITTGAPSGCGSPSNLSFNNSGNFFVADLTVTAPLPVELTKFTALNNNNSIKLNWQTASEINNDRFEVERSLDGATFRTIGTQKGQGNSQSITNYTFIDKTPVNGMNYYRLKDVAFDGTFSYSKVVAIQVGKKTNFVAYPNPATSSINIEYEAQKDESSVNIQVYDIFGKVQVSSFMDLSEGINILPLEISQLAVGSYFIKVRETVVRFEKN
jgi:hypothetical protein